VHLFEIGAAVIAEELSSKGKAMVDARPELAQLSDGELLDRFAKRHEDVAFGELVQRHAALVLNVCQRVTQNLHDAEDAFQATFMVLLRKGEALDGRRSLGNWLYSVAYRCSLKVRDRTRRQRSREQMGLELEVADKTLDAVWLQLGPVLDEELSQLPSKYRQPLVLCYLDGKTQQEAAMELGWPAGSMSRRMNRARALLLERLKKRGIVLTMGVFCLALAENAKAAAASPELIASTSGQVTNIPKGGLSPGRIALALALFIGLIAASIGWAAPNQFAEAVQTVFVPSRAGGGSHCR
jgi:RNA polymerase sigma factor (sigma-70 family)